MMNSGLLRGLAVSGLLAAVILPASAQEPSTGCRLFPLACPGPTPAPPPPLLGTPEEQAQAAPPMPAKHAMKRRAARKRAAKAAPQQ